MLSFNILYFQDLSENHPGERVAWLRIIIIIIIIIIFIINCRRILGTSENFLFIFVTLLAAIYDLMEGKFGEARNSIQPGDYATGSPGSMRAYLLSAFFCVCVVFQLIS